MSARHHEAALAPSQAGWAGEHPVCREDRWEREGHVFAASKGSDGIVRLQAQEALMDAPLVSRDPEVMSGALCFTGTRVPVRNLFDYLEGGSTLEAFLEDFPSVSRETAVAVLEAARERLSADAPAT
jgi:uncharacterized protein (DUF433 family)